ncbi:T9SS sorting signal type C domain-containing protein [Flavobacterium notoginsengisoli]|uniref:T9SS sorting signal type C domain-containing protein n=1 Tax=Flavobacterium notoginsengisoli TaxID=1478199 RepID=UPI00363FB6E6
MKKLYLSSLMYFILQFFLSLYTGAAHSAASPVESSLTNLKSVCFKKSENAPQEEIHRVWLNLTNTDGIFKQILIGYIKGATNGWDPKYDGYTLDAYKFADFYSINEGRKLVIQGRALPLEMSDTIPLGYRSAITGDLTISIDRADGDLAARDIYLLDKQAGTIHNLRDGGYTFSTTIGVFTDRFEIRYTEDQKLGTHESTIVPQKLTVASKNKVISLRSDAEPLKEVSVFDITGKLLYSSQEIGKSDLEITGIQSGMQILLVKTTFENGNTSTKKVLF